MGLALISIYAAVLIVVIVTIGTMIFEYLLYKELKKDKKSNHRLVLGKLNDSYEKDKTTDIKKYLKLTNGIK